MSDNITNQEITLRSKSNFLFSFFFLPKEKRRAIYTLYAFCRQTDDIADNLQPVEKRLDLLNRWEKELKNCLLRKVSNYFTAIRYVAEHFKIPFEYFFELIDGVRMDLQNLQYRTFEELKLYCYRVASIVGLMSIEIFGYRDPIIKKYAENLGIALQLTNIIRDVGSDARMGRLYLPEEDLQKFEVPENDIFDLNYSENFRELMHHQAQRAHRYYRVAEEHLPDYERPNMLVSEIMKNIYLTLLRKIESTGYSVLNHSIRLSTPAKFYITLKTASQIKLQT